MRSTSGRLTINEIDAIRCQGLTISLLKNCTLLLESLNDAEFDGAAKCRCNKAILFYRFLSL